MINTLERLPCDDRGLGTSPAYRLRRCANTTNTLTEICMARPLSQRGSYLRNKSQRPNYQVRAFCSLRLALEMTQWATQFVRG